MNDEQTAAAAAAGVSSTASGVQSQAGRSGLAHHNVHPLEDARNVHPLEDDAAGMANENVHPLGEVERKMEQASTKADSRR